MSDFEQYLLRKPSKLKRVAEWDEETRKRKDDLPQVGKFVTNYMYNNDIEVIGVNPFGSVLTGSCTTDSDIDEEVVFGSDKDNYSRGIALLPQCQTELNNRGKPWQVNLYPSQMPGDAIIRINDIMK